MSVVDLESVLDNRFDLYGVVVGFPAAPSGVLDRISGLFAVLLNSGNRY